MYMKRIKQSVQNEADAGEYRQLQGEVKKLYSNLQRVQMEEEEEEVALGMPSGVASKAARKKARPDTISYKAKLMKKK